MKTRYVMLLGALLTAGVSLPAASAVMISLNPAAQRADVGSTALVDLSISGLGDGVAPSLAVFDLNITFDASILGFQSVTFGNQLDLFGLGSIQEVTSGAGTLNLLEFSLDFPGNLDSLQQPSFLLASLAFDVLRAGDAIVSIATEQLGDSLGDPLPLAQRTDATISAVTPVPAPSSSALMVVGILGMARLSMRRATQ